MDWLLVAALSTYYVVAALNRTPGPFGAFWRLRQNQSLPFYCAICLAPWAALAALLAWTYLPHEVSYVLALAGAVVAFNDVREAVGNW